METDDEFSRQFRHKPLDKNVQHTCLHEIPPTKGYTPHKPHNQSALKWVLTSPPHYENYISVCGTALYFQ